MPLKNIKETNCFYVGDYVEVTDSPNNYDFSGSVGVIFKIQDPFLYIHFSKKLSKSKKLPVDGGWFSSRFKLYYKKTDELKFCKKILK